MKLLFTFLFTSFCFLSYSQVYPRPQFKNQPVQLIDSSLVKLEKRTAESKIKVKGLGYGGREQTISVSEQYSPVRISTKPTFLIWVDEGIDPETVIILTRVEVSKKGRNIPLTKFSAFAGYGARGNSMSGKYNVQYDIEIIGGGVYKITPVNQLMPGTEYAFYNPEKTQAPQLTIFLFGTK